MDLTEDEKEKPGDDNRSIDECRQEIEALNEAIRDREDLVVKLRGQIGKQLSRGDDYCRRANSLDHCIRKAVSQKRMAEARLATCVSNLQVAQNRLAKSERDRGTVETQLAKTERERGMFQEELANSERQRNKVEAEVAFLRDQIRKVWSENRVLQTEANNLTRELRVMYGRPPAERW